MDPVLDYHKPARLRKYHPLAKLGFLVGAFMPPLVYLCHRLRLFMAMIAATLLLLAVCLSLALCILALIRIHDDPKAWRGECLACGSVLVCVLWDVGLVLYALSTIQMP